MYCLSGSGRGASRTLNFDKDDITDLLPLRGAGELGRMSFCVWRRAPLPRTTYRDCIQESLVEQIDNYKH